MLQMYILVYTGRYHIERCVVLNSARRKAEEDGTQLTQIANISIDEDVFKKPKTPRPKPAKIAGFVVSSSVRLDNPFEAPTDIEKRQGVKTGKKGYIRCKVCNKEVYAPNAKHHEKACPLKGKLPLKLVEVV